MTASATLLPADRDRLLAGVRALARDKLRPIADAGEHGRVNRALVAALAEHGLLPRLFPPGLGGTADPRPTATELCILREALAGECPAAETAFAVQGLGSHPILQAGRPEVVQRWIPAVARGQAVAAFALTEPDAGSDAGALSLRAEPADGGYRLSGTKQWISHAPDADVYAIFARTSDDAGARGITAFAMPGDAPGLTGEPVALISPHAIGRLELDGVFVPHAAVLGDVDHGFRVAMQTLDLFRPSVGAAAVGMGQAALDAAVDRASTRRAFGGTLQDLQAVSHPLADVATALQAARLLVHDAATAHDAGVGRTTRQAAMAKLFATEAAQQAVDVAVQVHGAAGLEQGSVVGELYREVRALRIYEGASEVQRTIIARELFRDREGEA